MGLEVVIDELLWKKRRVECGVDGCKTLRKQLRVECGVGNCKTLQKKIRLKCEFINCKDYIYCETIYI